MRRLRQLLASVSLVAAMALSPSAFAFDLVQFTTNYIWCWQHDNGGIGQDALRQSCQQGLEGACSYTDGMPHKEFVGDVVTFYRLNQPDDLRSRYEMCQAHNRRALDYAKLSRAEVMRGVKHMIACYPPRKGAAKLADGAPATPEAQRLGIQMCGPL